MEDRLRSRVTVADPLAPVRVSPVRVNGSSVTNQGIEILNDAGDWEAINIHSASYNLIPNEEVARTTREILRGSGMTWKPAREIWTGRYWAMHFMSDVSVRAPKVGDALSLGLRVENSYDGSCQFRLQLLAYVLSCANGMVSSRYFTTYRMRHTSNHQFNIPEAVSVLQTGMDEVVEIVPAVEELSEIPLTIDLLAQVSRVTDLPNGEWGYITKALSEAQTAWDLMQVITHRLTHFGRGKSSLQYEERIGEYFLHTLAGSAA